MHLFFHHLLISFSCAFITWCLYLKIKHTTLIDLNWVIGLFSLAIYDYIFYPIYFPLEATPFVFSNFHLITLTLVGFWSIRLASFFIITRILPGIQDSRYNYLKQSYKKNENFNLLLNYFFQAFLQAILSSIFIMGITLKQPIYLYMYAGILVSVIGIIGQAIADYQLHVFKKQSNSSGLCQTGLWFYSRHPNYFFEILFWIGISFIFYSSLQNIFVFFAPSLMYLIMRFLTGPLTEKISIAKRGQTYLEYKKNTPMIFLNLFKGK